MTTDTEFEWMRLTFAELSARAAEDALVIIPVASHGTARTASGDRRGHHLATGVAHRIAAPLAAAGRPVVVMPCVWTGLAEHHVAFGGTVTLDYESFAGC